MHRSPIHVVLATALAGLPLLPIPSEAAPHVETVNGHKVLVVDGAPFLDIAVQMQENTERDPNGLDAEAYMSAAHDIGFRAVRVPVRWRTFSDRLERPVFRAVDPTRADLDAIVAAARARGLKLNVAWEGSNLFGRAHFAPASIAGRAGTFHPEGDFPPPPGFDFLNGPLSYPNPVLVTGANGALPITQTTSTANDGVFCPDWPSNLALERAAIADLGDWIARQQADGDLVITVQLENELALVDEPDIEAIPTQRCRCALSDFLFEHPDVRQPGFDASFPTFGEYLRARPELEMRLGRDEAYTQWSLQRYVAELGRTVQARLPGMPVIVNVFGKDSQATQEIDHPGSPAHDVEGWVDYGGVVSAGPDMFGFLNQVYDADFATARNFLYAPEFGAQYYPHFQIFGTLGSNVASGGPRFIGMGMSTFALFGDVVSLFTGLVSDGVTRGLLPNAPQGFWFQNILFDAYHAAYYARATNAAIGSAMAPLARFQGTSNLLAFFDLNYLDGRDTFSGGSYDLGGVPVTISDRGSPSSPARGALVRSGVRDITLVGVSYSARVGLDARDPAFAIERGEWRGERWVKLADPLDGTVSVDAATGAVTVLLSSDERSNSGPLEIGGGGPLDLQYAVRIYDTVDPGPDREGDGVADSEDNCPDVSNPGQLDGDRDGIGDLCDEDSVDLDGDGVPDAADNCPSFPNSDQADSDRDGVGDLCELPPPGSGARGGGGGCSVAANGASRGVLEGLLPGVAAVLVATRVRRRAAARAQPTGRV